jgi:DNA polymerase II small subunit/DNA polymerase delta subunit B
MHEMQSAFDSSYNDLEEAKAFNENVKLQLDKAHSEIEMLMDDKCQLDYKIQDYERKYQSSLHEIELRETEKENIIDHIKKQAENAVAFYKNKYERMMRPS